MPNKKIINKNEHISSYLGNIKKRYNLHWTRLNYLKNQGFPI